MTEAPTTPRRSRWGLLAVGAGTIASGLLLRSIDGAAGDIAGGVLYAVLVFVVIAFVGPAASTRRIAAVTLTVCVAVELLQLTGVPSTLAAIFPPTRLVLGTTFVATDLLIAALGTGIAVLGDLLLLRRLRGRAAAGQ